MKEVRILIGIPASGKSTFAKNFVFSHKDYKIVSTDDIRWKLFGNPSIQGNPKMIFAIAYKDIMSYLDKGCNVIFDATNITRKNRVNLINFLKDCEVENIVADYFPVTIDVALERNQQRNRHVPEKVIHKMFGKIEKPKYEEGFSEINCHTD